MSTHSSHNYIVKRRHSYYYRRRVPVLLKAFFSGKEFIISLQTKHFRDAKKLANRYDDYFTQLLFQEKLKNMDIDPSKIHGFTIKTNSDGSKTTEVTPEIMESYVKAGLSPDQIATILNGLIEINQMSGADIGKPPVELETNKSPNLLLSQVIKLYHEDLKTKQNNRTTSGNHQQRI